MKFIRTMTGDISPEELGFTYSHEHIVCIPPYWEQKGEFDLLLDDPQKSEEEIKAAKEAGVNAVVDATAIDYGRQPQIVHDISVRTGMYIIGTAGFNKSFLWEAQIPGEKRSFKEWIEGAKIEELTDFAVGEIEKGMQKTEVKAGQVKFGTGYNSISPLEIKTLRAACRAHHSTGAPIHSHTEVGTMALEQIQYLKEEGVNLCHVSFGHMDRNPDTYYHLKVAETGAYLCFDGIAKIKYCSESVRIKCILELVKRGYQSQILVSGDMARKSYYASYGDALGLPYIKTTWCARLIEEAEEAGINGKKLVESIFIFNPRECFTFKKEKL